MEPIQTEGTFQLSNSGLSHSRLDKSAPPRISQPNVFEEYLKKTGKIPPPPRDRGPGIK